MRKFRFKVNLGLNHNRRARNNRSQPESEPTSVIAASSSVSTSTPAVSRPKDTNKTRSRMGCSTCRRRRVKCDETFPVCLRCQQRGDFCESVPRLRTWQLESPWIFQPTVSNATQHGLVQSHQPKDSRLIRHWIEKASQIMVIDPDINPMAFPILDLIDKTPSLTHAIQSVSDAHIKYFNPTKLARCQDERHRAICLVSHELSNTTRDSLYPVFLTVLLLGLSTPWISGPHEDFGLHHLLGARALIDILLSDSIYREENHATFSFMLGAYLYWDMACSFLVRSELQVSIDTSEIQRAVQGVGRDYHPISGFTTDLFPIIGAVGRYCRRVVETGDRDEEIEQMLNARLHAWETKCDGDFALIGEGFRSHGLINMAAITRKAQQHQSPVLQCEEAQQAQRQSVSNEGDDYFAGLMAAASPLTMLSEIDPSWSLDDFSSGPYPMQGLDLAVNVPIESGESPVDGAAVPMSSPSNRTSSILSAPPSYESDFPKSAHDLALETVDALISIPPTNHCTVLQAIPLFTAASELTSRDAKHRAIVQNRFRELYSLNHLRSSIAALQLLADLWALKDAGEDTYWLELMLRKGWSLMLG